MIYCGQCSKPIHAERGGVRTEDCYVHDDTGSAFCDAPSLEAARENGFRVAMPQARPDLKRVTLANIHELAPQ